MEGVEWNILVNVLNLSYHWSLHYNLGQCKHLPVINSACATVQIELQHDWHTFALCKQRWPHGTEIVCNSYRDDFSHRRVDPAPLVNDRVPLQLLQKNWFRPHGSLQHARRGSLHLWDEMLMTLWQRCIRITICSSFFEKLCWWHFFFYLLRTTARQFQLGNHYCISSGSC